MNQIKNILSIDLEDYYCDLPLSSWDKFVSRVESNTQIILKMLEKYNVKATFFTLGYIAEKFPGLIEEVVSKGHEIASHGYSHTDIRKMNRENFEEDLSKSLAILQKISGERVLGFRAPFFSINKQNFWVFEILKKHLRYDSSIFPVRTPLYGIPEAPRNIYRMSSVEPLKIDDDSDFFEIPPATIHFPLIGNLPIAGGFHMRFLPYKLIKIGLTSLNKKGSSAMFYVHPRDFDLQMPKIPDYAWHYYWGIRKAKKKFESLLKNFKFSSVTDVLSL